LPNFSARKFATWTKRKISSCLWQDRFAGSARRGGERAFWGKKKTSMMEFYVDCRGSDVTQRAKPLLLSQRRVESGKRPFDKELRSSRKRIKYSVREA